MIYKADAQAAYVLHSRPYLETSALIDFFTLEYGRVSAIAKGARRPNSKLRGVLQPFVPLQIAWRGKQELKTLTLAEPVGLNGILQGRALICGLYINELLQRLLSPYDPHPRLYVYYQYVINELVAGQVVEEGLRVFEKKLLAEIGYGLSLDQVSEQGTYFFNVDHWCFVPVEELAGFERSRCFSGKSLCAIEQDDYATLEQRQAAKRLMRLAIDYLLADRPLQSRALFRK